VLTTGSQGNKEIKNGLVHFFFTNVVLCIAMDFEAIFMTPMIARTIRISIAGNSHELGIEG
jgi:hypothetical protein